MKNVWIFNHDAIEPGGSGATRHYNLSKYLLHYGWRSSVIAASVEYNTGRQRLGKRESVRLSNYNGVDFLWVKVPKYKGNGIGRILNMLTYTFRVMLPATTKRLPPPDVIIGSSVHPFAAFAARVIAWRYGVPFVFEVRDLWPQTLIDFGRIKQNSVLAIMLRWLERWLYKRSAKIIVLMPFAHKYIVPLGIDRDKIVWLPNGVDISWFPEAPLVDKGEHDPFIYMYFGAHGEANGLENLVKAMSIVEEDKMHRPIFLHLVGDGPLKGQLIELSKSLALENIVFLPPVPKVEISQLAAKADAFVFNLQDVPVFRFGISSNKLYDFLACGRPILFCSNAKNNPVEEAEAGITVPPGDPAKLAEAMINLALSPYSDRKKMGLSGRLYVEQNNNFNILSKKLSMVLDDVVQK